MSEKTRSPKEVLDEARMWASNWDVRFTKDLIYELCDALEAALAQPEPPAISGPVKVGDTVRIDGVVTRVGDGLFIKDQLDNTSYLPKYMLPLVAIVARPEPEPAKTCGMCQTCRWITHNVYCVVNCTNMAPSNVCGTFEPRNPADA